MKKITGQVLKLFIANSETKNMDEVMSSELILGGIVGDKYFGREDREILLTSLCGYELALANNISMPFGTLGENILIDIDLKNLKIGDRLKISETIIEISMLCPVCTHLSSIKKELPKLIKDDRGIFGKVIQSGIVKIGDKVLFK